MKRAQISRSRPNWLAPLDNSRDEEILAAAFDVFAEKGFHGATMLEIATRASASKKTLYERFQDKAALFRALIAWGSRRNLPDAIPQDDGKPALDLEQHGIRILTAMMRPESLALFRIVAAEATRFPELGKHFDAATRKSSVAILDALAERLTKSGDAKIGDRDQFGDDFIALLRGDIYFRALAGAIPPLSAKEIRTHARAATQKLLAIYRR